MRKYRKEKGITRVFYMDEQYLIINKLKCELFVLVYIPLRIKFAVMLLIMLKSDMAIFGD